MRIASLLQELYLHPRSAARLLRRVRDVPAWLQSEARDRMGGGEFVRFYGMVRPYSMASKARLRGLYQAVRQVVSANVAGDVVECGTARGGSAALMGLTLQELKTDRRLWVFDTFRGLPPPTDADPDYRIAKLCQGGCIGELSEVTGLFDRYGLLAQTRFVEGLFQETVPSAEVEQIAVLHLDGDWYESVKVCLDHLYDKVTPGGIIQIDDYGHWEGARRAVDEFFSERGMAMRLRRLDYTGRQLVKPDSSGIAAGPGVKTPVCT